MLFLMLTSPCRKGNERNRNTNFKKEKRKLAIRLRNMENFITITTSIEAPITKVWDLWTTPIHIQNWCFASDDWHCPKAVNHLLVGEKFSSTMAAKDGSMSFDFSGTYTKIIDNSKIAYTIEDGRKVEISFETENGKTKITERFEPETTNPREMQQAGWQAILDNFKRYAELR